MFNITLIYNGLFAAQAPGGNPQGQGPVAARPAVPAAPKAEPLCNGNEIDCILEKSWAHYKQFMIEQGPGPEEGRPYGILDKKDEDGDGDKDELVTFSETVSYVLLRAAWMNDRETFRKVWNWAKNHLQRRQIEYTYEPGNRKGKMVPGKKDHLFAWKYFDKVYRGEKGGVMYNEDKNIHDLDPASDADLDIAAALISAYKKWGVQEYLDEARLILKDVWAKETTDVNGQRVLLGGDTQDNVEGTSGINPSYFRWGYYGTIFAEYDPGHDWKSMIESSHKLVIASADTDRKTSKGATVEAKVNLPPDWLALTPDHKIVNHSWIGDKGNTRFGGDAFRILFWIAQANDLAAHGLASPDDYARRYLTDHSGSRADAGPYYFLKKELDEKGRIKSGYKLDGTLPWREAIKNNAAYLAYFYESGDLASARKLYSRLMKDYDKRGFWGRDPREYYDQNWAWFALALLRRGASSLWDNGAKSRDLKLPPVLAQLAARPDLPEGFRFVDAASDFLDEVTQNLDDVSSNSDTGLNYYLKSEKNFISGMNRAAANRAYGGDQKAALIKKVWPKIAEKNTLLWLMHRDIADPQAKWLNDALVYFNKLPAGSLLSEAGNRFWLGKLAMILTGELDRPENLAVLSQPPFKFGNDSLGQGLKAARITKKEKKAVYEKIYTYILADLKDPLLKADNLFMRGIMELDLNDPAYKEHFDEAERLLEPLVNSREPKNKRLIDEYTAYLKRRILLSSEKARTADEKQEELFALGTTLANDLAAAVNFTAEIKLLRSGKEKEAAEEVLLKQASDLLDRAAREFGGIKYASAKVKMAEALARRASFLKNREEKGYEKLFGMAKTLLQDVIDWKKEYDALFGADKEKMKPAEWAKFTSRVPRHLRQSVALAHLWMANIRLIEIGEEQRTSRQETVAYQRVELEKVAGWLEGMEAELEGEPALQAQISLAFGKQQVRLAYALKDLDADRTKILNRLKTALLYLDRAKTGGSDLTQAESYLWLAKAESLSSDFEPDRKTELANLAAAKTAIDRALQLQPRVKELKGQSLSDVHATFGEILLKQGDFRQAVPELQRAIDIFPKNYDAILNLADIKSWQEDYPRARELYGRVNGFSPRLKLRAELGKAEVAILQHRDYSPKTVASLKKIVDEVINTEPQGSYLLLRAASDLADAYREARDTAGKPRYGEVYKLAEGLLKKTSSPRLKALLYLKWAEAAEWLKDTDDTPKLSAGEILRKARADKEVKALLAGKESLELGYQLLEKELALRADEKTDLFEDGKFRQKIVASEDAGLISRYISDRVEAATVAAGNSNDFDKLIGLLRSYLDGKEEDLRELAKLNNKKEAGNASRRLVRKLRLQLADALLWDKQYEKAEKEYQAILGEDEKKYPLPAVDNAPIRAWALFGLGEVYRYGGPVRNKKAPLDFYVDARDEAQKIKGDEEAKNYLLARIYLGLAKLADQNGSVMLDGKENLAADLLAKADDYKAGIYCRHKKAYAPFFDELRANALVLKRDWKHPEIETSTAYYYNNQISKVNEFRLGLTLTEPLLFNFYGRRAELDARVRINTDFDRKSNSIRQAYSLGLLFKPLSWLSLEAEAKLSSRYLEKNGRSEFSYLRNPDLQAAVGVRAPQGTPFIQGLSAVVSAGFFSGNNRKLNSYYGNIIYNFGRDFNHPAVQGLSLAIIQLNRFAFPYNGGVPERLRVSFPSPIYETGLGRLDLIRLKLEAGAFYERAVDYSHDGAIAYPKNNLGFAVGGGATFNAWGYLGLKIGYRLEGIRQDVDHAYPAPAEPWLTNHQFSGSLNLRF